ncbi:sporulation protein [Nocardia bovistercoris]|uniref:Sporulation protein n=1 Tax=Nocardia bovistercoris TaxID=2785916 RepID=A0A931N5T3_9NOCA|nr:sporulation protein [Nocardia bovistercoris]MBH0780052.1 sporulation protein [Nocardia bovistercoris]
MFKKLLAAAGVGGAEVETELFTPGVQPGGVVEGVIRLRGGNVGQDISRIAVEFVTRVEQEYEDHEGVRDMGFGWTHVYGPLHLPAGAPAEFRFGARAPLETPITFYNGRHLPGTVVSVRTVVEIQGAVDAADTDPIGVGALPAQHIVLEALERLGFHLRSADVEAGHIRDSPQQLPFYQEIEFSGSPNYPQLNQLEVTFIATEHGMNVVLEADKRGTWFAEGSDVFDSLWVDYATLGHRDWAGELHHRVVGMTSRH